MNVLLFNFGLASGATFNKTPAMPDNEAPPLHEDHSS